MKPRNMFLNAVGLLCAAALLQSCAITPDSIIEARSEVSAAERDGVTAKYAPTTLADARDQLNAAEKANNERTDRRIVDHEANQAKRKAQIAVEQGKTNKAQADIAQADAERQKLVLNRLENLAARATAASEKAEADLRRAEDARRQAELERLRAEEERRLALERDRDRARLSADTERSRAEELARQLAAEEAARRAAENEASRRLAALDAKQTPRGQMITLPDVLFEFDRYNLTARGQQTVQKIVDFLRDYPDRKALVEGHTDSIGNRSYNQRLSERRADSVVAATIRAGISPSRISALGYSEDYPVASNETESGRAQNRRVELYISDDNRPVRPRR